MYDVVVVGGGSAGCAAAIAAARLGVSVLLLERYGFLGGTGTQVLDSFYGFFTPGATARRVVGGIGWEVVEALEREGEMLSRPSSYGAGTAVTYNPETLKRVWDRMVTGSGADLLLHALCIGIARHDRGWALEVATRTDRRSVAGRVVVDAGGDAQVATWAGARSEPVDAARLQALTTTFRVVGVDGGRAREVRHAALAALMLAADGDGYSLPRLDGSIHVTPTPGSFVANMTRVAGINPLDPVELTRAEVEGRRQVDEYVRFLRDRVPGYESCRLDWTATQIGIRESRRIVGRYTLTREDVLRARRFLDDIALCGAPIEVHRPDRGTTWEYLPDGETVGIPLRCLVPAGLPDLLVAGRCLSASHEAHAAVRSMGQCLAMGHAAGVAAALAVRAGGTDGVEAATVREVLYSQGAILERPVYA